MKASFYGAKGRERRRQLYMHAWLLKENFDFLPEVLCFNLFRENKELCFDFSEMEYQETLLWMAMVEEELIPSWNPVLRPPLTGMFGPITSGAATSAWCAAAVRPNETTNSKRKVNPMFVYIGNGNYVQSDNIFAVLKNSGNPAKAFPEVGALDYAVISVPERASGSYLLYSLVRGTSGPLRMKKDYAASLNLAPGDILRLVDYYPRPEMDYRGDKPKPIPGTKVWWIGCAQVLMRAPRA